MTERTRIAGEVPPTNMMNPQAHHWIPKASDIREKCALVGIDVNAASVDGVQLGRWVEGSSHGRHQNWSKQHLTAWRTWFAQHPNPTKLQILNQVEIIDNPTTFPPY